MRWPGGLFAHRPVDPSAVDAHLPAGVGATTYGDAWLGTVADSIDVTASRLVPVGE